MNISIVYWSGTGNTEKMARAVLEGARSGGAEADLVDVDSAKVDEVLASDAIALGCPAMGAEVLEEGSMEPFVEALESKDLKGKNMLLFGSYDWGDGEWMRNWTDRMKAAGAICADEGFIAHNDPDDEALESLKNLGRSLANARA